MKIEVKLFAAARQAANQELVEIEIADQGTVNDLKIELVKCFPQLESMLDHLLVAVDAEYAKEDQILLAGCEVAVIPPVSGG